MPRRQRHLGYLLAAASLLVIGALTLLPAPEEAERAASTPLYCILCGDLGSVDFFLNTLLFVPLGAGLAVAGFSWRRIVVLAALTSVTIELLQFTVIAGRDASLGDVLANTIGAGSGAFLAARWRRFALPDVPGARRLALAYAALLLWIWAGTAWSLGPALPQGVRWFGAWAPEYGNFERFLGKPLMVTAGEEPLLPGPALDQQRIEDELTAHPTLSFQAVLAAPPPGLAPIGSIVDAWHRNVMLIGQDRDDLVFGLRMRASILRLRNPLAVLRGGLAGQPGDTVEAEGALRDGGLELSSRNHDRIATVRLPLSASWGWSLVTPWDAGYGREMYFLTGLWVAGLLGMLLYWCVWAGGASFVIPAVTVLLMLGGIPYAAGFSPAHWSEWAAAAVGALFGVLAARAAQGGKVRREPEGEEATG
jgi:hypothetical protein